MNYHSQKLTAVKFDDRSQRWSRQSAVVNATDRDTSNRITDPAAACNFFNSPGIPDHTDTGNTTEKKKESKYSYIIVHPKAKESFETIMEELEEGRIRNKGTTKYVMPEMRQHCIFSLFSVMRFRLLCFWPSDIVRYLHQVLTWHFKKRLKQHPRPQFCVDIEATARSEYRCLQSSPDFDSSRSSLLSRFTATTVRNLQNYCVLKPTQPPTLGENGNE